MDDRNGECFGHHEDLCFEGPINASDSEHGHLKDFLLEPRHSVRNMPCNTDSDRAEKILNVCMQTEMTGGEDLFDSCTDTVNFSSERTEESDIPSNCVGLINSQSSYSSTVEGTNCESERNGSYHLPSLNQEDLADLSESLKGGEVRDGEHNQCKEEAETENSSNLSLMVEKNTDSDKTSTECADNQICDSKELPVVSRQLNVHKLLQTESVGQEELDSAQFSERSITPRGRNVALRGHKGKGAEVTVRGRTPGPAKKKKHSVTYQSQISPDQNGIKIRIKKSSASPTVVRPSRRRERGKKRKSKKGSNTEDECDVGSNKRVKCKDSSISVQSEVDGSGEQSDWGLRLPKEILHDIFFMVTQDEGCLPFLVRASQVCRLWRDVALSPSLWYNIDLASPCIKDKYKTSETVRWLCENRLTSVQELNVGGWKFVQIEPVLDVISKYCQDLRGLNLTGWKGLNSEHLKFLIAKCPLLSRLDLSSINPETNQTRSALSLFSISHLTQTMGDRLTHLILANNRLAAIPQLITAIATHCANLQVLDLSNLRTVSHTTALLHIEKLQEGCQKLRVLRITNSQIALSAATLKEQVASPGFPALEELSVAGNAVDGFCSTPVMDDNSVERILKSSHKLKLLDVRGCSRVSDSSLVRVPAWDLEHLFLSGCYVTRLTGAGLELIAQKWSHSLIEVDLAWSTATQAVDLAVTALAEQGAVSPLRVLNLCGSSVSLSPVKAILLRCPLLISLNLSSCRALPRGMKRLYEGNEVTELRSTFEEKPEAEKEAKPSPEQEEMETEKVVGQNDQDSVLMVGENGASCLEEILAVLYAPSRKKATRSFVMSPSNAASHPSSSATRTSNIPLKCPNAHAKTLCHTPKHWSLNTHHSRKLKITKFV